MRAAKSDDSRSPETRRKLARAKFISKANVLGPNVECIPFTYAQTPHSSAKFVITIIHYHKRVTYPLLNMYILFEMDRSVVARSGARSLGTEQSGPGTRFSTLMWCVLPSLTAVLVSPIVHSNVCAGLFIRCCVIRSKVIAYGDNSWKTKDLCAEF